MSCGCHLNLLALVQSSLEVLLMLALLSRFFLPCASRCLLWLEEGGDEEELVLARESSSDIPVWTGEEPRTWGKNKHTEECQVSSFTQFSQNCCEGDTTGKYWDTNISCDICLFSKRSALFPSLSDRQYSRKCNLCRESAGVRLQL